MTTPATARPRKIHLRLRERTPRAKRLLTLALCFSLSAPALSASSARAAPFFFTPKFTAASALTEARRACPRGFAACLTPMLCVALTWSHRSTSSCISCAAAASLERHVANRDDELDATLLSPPFPCANVFSNAKPSRCASSVPALSLSSFLASDLDFDDDLCAAFCSRMDARLCASSRAQRASRVKAGAGRRSPFVAEMAKPGDGPGRSKDLSEKG